MSTAAKRPQLELDELRRLKWLLGGALALLSLWTVFFLDVEALALTGVAGAVIVSVLLWPQLPGRVPVFVWRLAVPAIIAAVALDFYSTPETLPVLIRLAILLVLYRAISYRRKREDLQLIVLTLFLIVVAGVLTVSLGFAFLLLLFTACALGFLFVITVADVTGPGGAQEDITGTPAWTRPAWAPFFRRLAAVADWRLLALAAALFTLVVGMSAVLFMVIPRFEIATGFFLDRYITRKSRTGFTETVRFGDVSELVRDDSIAMRVDLTDASTLREMPFWRLVVLDEYTPEGFKLSQGLKAELMRDQSVRQYLRGRATFGDRDAVGGQWTIYVEPGVSRFLPLPGYFSMLRLRDRLPVQASPQFRLVALRTEPMTMTALQLDGVVLQPTIADGRFRRQLADARRAGSDPTARLPSELRRYDPMLSLRGPQGIENEAVLARMVTEITGGELLTATEFAERATKWLRDRHAYALSARIPRGGKDDIVKWLESAEPGFCEYFAAGLAVLCRAAGHPARVIAGFRGGSLNAYESYIMVRNTDAHAWCEVFDGEETWARMDPTPGGAASTQAGAQEVSQQATDASWSARWDSLRVIWYRRIVNFDSRQQVEMVEAVKSLTTDSGQRLRDWLNGQARRLKAWLLAPWDLRRIGFLAALAALAVALGLLLLRGGRRLWWRWLAWRQPGQFDPVRLEAGKRLARLRAALARQLEAPHRDLLLGAINELERLRYGHRATWPDPAGVFARARQALHSAKT